MLRLTPRDPAKPPRIFTWPVVCLMLVQASLIIVAMVAHAMSPVLPFSPTVKGVAIFEVGPGQAEWVPLDSGDYDATITARCLCWDGQYSTHSFELVTTGRWYGERYRQYASPFSAADALAGPKLHYLPIPFLGLFQVGFDVSSDHGNRHFQDFPQVMDRVDAWVRRGPHRSRPLHSAITQSSAVGPFHVRPGIEYISVMVVGAAAGIGAIYFLPIVAIALGIRGIRRMNWHKRRAKGICVECGYPIATARGPTCPECGTRRVGVIARV